MMKLILHTNLTERLTTAALRTPPIQRQSRHFHASALADCMRMGGYDLLGVPQSDPRYDPDYALAASQGDVIHEALQAQMVAAGVVYQLPNGPAIEVPLADHGTPELARYHLSGRIDAVLSMNDGALAILDIKTVASKAIGGPWWDEKLDHYKAQVLAYMHFFQAPDGRQARTGFVYVVARDDTKVRALYRLAYDEHAVAANLARLALAADAVRAGVLPEPEPTIGPCRFCEWRSLCPAWKG